MKEEIKPIDLYTDKEVMQMIKDKEILYYADTGVDEVIIKEQDIPDFIIKINSEDYYGHTCDVKIYKMNSEVYEPVLTTYGDFLNKCEPELREKIIGRLVKLQRGETKVRNFKVIDEDQFEKVQNKMEELKRIKRKNREAR